MTGPNVAATDPGLLRNSPARVGEIAEPIERAMPVTPAAVERSSGATRTIVWDGEDTYALCEINVSSVLPLSKASPSEVARLALVRLESAKKGSR